MRVLIAGATEFFAPFIADDLVAHRHEVAALEGGAADPGSAGFPSTALRAGTKPEPRLAFGDGVEWIEGAVALAEAVRMWRPDAVVDMRHDGPARAHEVLEACAGTRSVHLSSALVYGANPVCPIDESAELVRPDRASPEVAALVEADRAVLTAIEGGASATILRMPHVYGPRDPRSAEWFFAKRVLDGRKRVAVPDAGLHICHRGFVQNMARGVVQALASPKAAGQVYNLGEEKLYTLAQLARAVARALDYDWEIHSAPGQMWRAPYDQTSFYDLRKARAQLRYRDIMIPRDGLELMLGWLCQSTPSEWAWPGIEGPFDYAREDALIEQCGRKLESE